MFRRVIRDDGMSVFERSTKAAAEMVTWDPCARATLYEACYNRGEKFDA